MTQPSVESVMDFLRLSDRVGTAGQPTEAQLCALGDAGYQVVINLRPTADTMESERALVEAQGLEYVQIQVDWQAPTPEDVAGFFEAMDRHADKRVFVHCARNMRVSAFLYLYRTLREGIPQSEALEDLRRLWTPNPTWQSLIDAVLAAPPPLRPVVEPQTTTTL